MEVNGSVDTRCGVGHLKKSSCLQKCATLWCFTVVAAFVVLLVTASYAYISSVQSTTQAVFSFSATDVGIWFAMFEVGNILSNLLASYFLTHRHIPRVLCVSMLLVIIGCLMHGLPHFFIDYGDKLFTTGNAAGQTAEDLISRSLCSANITNSSTIQQTEQADVNSYTSVLVIYGFAALINGLGYGPFYSLGLSFVDTNAEGEHGASKYIAFIMAMYTVGPIAGFAIGGALLSQYVTLGETYLNPNDHEWIGAWWIGYFLFAALITIFVPFMGLFPRKIPLKGFDVYSAGMELKSEVNEENLSQDASTSGQTRSVKGFLPTLGRLFINPLYVTEILASCAGTYYVSGWLGFLPKFFEEQFYYSAFMASILSGVIPPILSAIAICIGGYIATRYKLSIQQDAKFIFFCVFTSVLMLVPLFFIKCTQYPAQDVPQNMSSCLPACECDVTEYSPVCFEGVTYFSPCQSKCTTYKSLDDESLIYEGCFCSMNATVTKGFCKEENCIAPYIYLTCAILCMVSFVTCATSAINILMRAVPEEDKSLALGVQSSVNSLAAWIPAPIVYGTLIDSACRVWEYPNGIPENPDWRGYCLEYDNEAYRLKYVSMTVGVMALSALFCGLGWWASHLKRYQTPVEDKEELEPSDKEGSCSTSMNK